MSDKEKKSTKLQEFTKEEIEYMYQERRRAEERQRARDYWREYDKKRDDNRCSIM